MHTDSSSRATIKKAVPKSRVNAKGADQKDTLHLTKHLEISPPVDELVGMIATAAYFCAQERHFEPGHELEDWLNAEKQIRAKFD